MLWHDGAELTSADVKATFDRIVKPPQGVLIPRSTLFKTVEEITTPDKYTIQFKLSEPRPPNFIMSAFASGWNVIISKKTLEGNNYNLRRVEIFPGTGPFKSKRRVENEVWVMEANKEYWNEGMPYLDGIEFYHALPFSTELGSAILSGRVDYARIVDPVTTRKAKATPGMSTATFNQSVIQGTWVNTKHKPLDDPRVRRALHLTFDRPVLIDVVKDVTPMRVGGFIYPFSEFSTPPAGLAKKPGYQEDNVAAAKEAKALITAAGHPDGIKELDFLVRDVASYRLWSQAIQAMLKESINVECDLRTVWSRCGSTTSPAVTTTSRLAPWCPHCWTHPITSTPGTKAPVRRTTRRGTAPSSTIVSQVSIARSMQPNAWRWSVRTRH
jgi:peptide/nickel transport system substrate-binding protein